MKFEIYKSILTLMMCNDPSQLSEIEQKKLEEWADDNAKKFGFEDWVEAYHWKGIREPRPIPAPPMYCNDPE